MEKVTVITTIYWDMVFEITKNKNRYKKKRDDLIPSIGHYAFFL